MKTSNFALYNSVAGLVGFPEVIYFNYLNIVSHFFYVVRNRKVQETTEKLEPCVCCQYLNSTEP